MTDINLLPEEERKAEGFERLAKKLSFFSIVLLAVAGISTLSILIFFTMLSQKRAGLVSTISDSSSKINSLKTTEDLVFVTKEKAANAETVLAKRLDIPNLFSKLAALVPQNVYFADVKFAGTKLVISGKAKTSADMSGLVSSLSGQDGSQLVENLSIESLVSDETGVYSFVISTQIVSN